MTETNTGHEGEEHLDSRTVVRKALGELSNDFELQPVDEIGQPLTIDKRTPVAPDESTGSN